jgi:hypothetical protein
VLGSIAANFFVSPSEENSNGFNSKIVRHWIRECKALHHTCSVSQSTPSRLPSRVLDLKPNGNPSKILLRTNTSGEQAEYVCLSYAWGTSQTMVLSLSSLQSFQAGIEFGELPPTLKDAVRTARELDIRYLWIDALCIIQDSGDDKIKELAKMQEYYKNSLLVIQPTGLQSVQDSFLGEARTQIRPPTHNLKQLGIERSRTLEIRFTTPDKYSDTVTLEIDPGMPEPLNLRGWVLQEQLLGPRILIFPGSGGIVWQCDELETSDGKVYTAHIDVLQTLERARLPLSPVALSHTNAPQLTMDEIMDAWTGVVNDYSNRNLTNSDDKLVAIAALAEEFGRRYDDQLGVYLAGHWRTTLLGTLFWIVLYYSAAPKLRAPSWSWAAVDHAVWPFGDEGDFEISPEDVEITDCTTQLAFPDLPFGPVTSGQLLIRGRLGTAVLFPDVSDDDVLSEFLLFDDQMRTNLIGEGHPDTKEKVPRAPTLLTLLYLNRSRGLLLEGVSTRTYTRIGAFVVGEVDSSTYNSLIQCTMETITIV